jgi:glycoside/pentoside/hexuronide:cation symporter, GPH family
MTESLPRGLRLGYGLGSVATGSFGTVPGLMLLPYLTDTLGVAAAVAGVVVFAPKAWDVVLNPVAGRISDRYVSPRGPRRPFLVRGGLGLAACFALLFAGPPLGWVVGDALWVVVLFVGCATAYAFFQVPYVAMPAEITDSYAERTRLMTWRVALLAVAILVSGATAPAIRNAVGGRDGYRVMGIFVALLIAAGTTAAYVGTRHAPVGAVAAAGGSLGDQLRTVSRARDFRLLLTTFVLQALATGSMLAGVDYVSRWVLGDKDASTVLFVCFVGPALLLTPAWAALASRTGKKKGYVASSLVLAAGALLLLGARAFPDLLVFLATGLVGVGYAGAQVFPLSMLPDVAAVDAARSGANRAGVFTGVWTAGETLGLALGPGLFGLVLAAGGYHSSSGGRVRVQPDSALTAITLGFSLLPAAVVLASLWWLARYSLGPAEVVDAEALRPVGTGPATVAGPTLPEDPPVPGITDEGAP